MEEQILIMKKISTGLKEIANDLLLLDLSKLLKTYAKRLDKIAIQLQAGVKPACERKLIISIENDTVLFDNLNDFKPLEFMGILHNAVSTADVLYKTKVMQMVEKASKSV